MSVKDVETFPSESPEHLSFSAQDRLDRACDRFEASRRAGERPRIEEYLTETIPSERETLLRELLILLPWHRRSSYEPDTPARGVPQSPRWRVGLVCARMRNFLAGVIVQSVVRPSIRMDMVESEDEAVG
ncbi:MAG: hypothetical protein WA746_31720 [Isosphaeraceae bacterium]